MKPLHATASVMVIAMMLHIPVLAQESEPAPDEKSEDDIVVTAERIRGQVDTDLPPVLELDEADIKAFGAGSIADLVAQLAPQVSSGSGRGSGQPIFLVNGKRVSGFREFRRYPPEAIVKVEVLPEEVALQYGYPATQRVINFILKDNFASRKVEVEYGGPTAGGRASGEAEASLLTINGSKRFQVGVEFNTSSMLTEDERGIIQTPGSVPDLATDPDPARFRSLAADSESIQLETTYNTVLGSSPDAGTISLNANLQRQHSLSLSGLDTVLLTGPGADTALRTLDANPLERRSTTTTAAFGSSINKPAGDWELALTLDATRTWSDSEIDKRRDTTALVDAAAAGTLAIDGVLPSVADAGFDEANSRTWTVDSLITARGNPFVLPAGEASLTLDAGYKWNRIESEDTRSALGETQLTRGRINGGINLGLPLTSEREGFLGAVGDFTLNASAGVDHLSDFGTLTDWSTGLTWRIGDRLSLTGSYSARDEAPSLTALGAPEVVTFNVPVFDLANSETVLATVTTGGNPLLLAEKQRDIKLGASYDFDLFDRANFLVEYFRTKSSDVTVGFPVLTPTVEAAFPDRITRDSSGTLTAIDRRSVSFGERNSSRIRYGFNLFGRVGSPQPQGGGAGASAPAAGGPPSAPSGGGQPPFDPERFAKIREQFCALEDPMQFDFSTLPEPMQARLRGQDGQIDPAKVQEMKQRTCSDDGAARQGPSPEQREAIRKAICTVPEGGGLPDLSAVPARFLARLRGPDGEIDPAKLAELRERICQDSGKQQGEGANARGGGGGPRGGGRGGPGGGGGGPFGGGNGQGRWFLSLYHSIELESEALVAPGQPVFDLLDGDALGEGGIPRHKVQLEGGLFYRGIGLRLSGNYVGSSRINGTGLPGSSDLYFNDLATFDLRLFVDLEQQKWLTGENPGFLKGARFSVRANNLLDAQQRVTDSTGTVPLSYQPGLIDPLGRQVTVEFRKVF